jgi:hypothetical protein
MLKIWSMVCICLPALYILAPADTQQKKEQQKVDNAEGAGGKKKKVTAAQLRVQKGTIYNSVLLTSL